MGLLAHCFTSVASWWRLAWSMSITQRPCRRRRLLSHQARGGEGSTVDLVSRSKDWPIKVHAGSQHGPHTRVYRFMLAEQKRTKEGHIKFEWIHKSWIIFTAYSYRDSAQKWAVTGESERTAVLPALILSLTCEVIIELEWWHISVHSYIPPWWTKRDNFLAASPGLAILLSSNKTSCQLPVPDLKQVTRVIPNSHWHIRETGKILVTLA